MPSGFEMKNVTHTFLHTQNPVSFWKLLIYIRCILNNVLRANLLPLFIPIRKPLRIWIDLQLSHNPHYIMGHVPNSKSWASTKKTCCHYCSVQWVTMFLSDPFICGHSPSQTDCQNQFTLTSIWGPKFSSARKDRNTRFIITFFFSETSLSSRQRLDTNISQGIIFLWLQYQK